MNKSTFILGCLALLVVLASTTVFAARYDLGSFDTGLVASASTTLAASLAVGTSNPTVGTTDGLVVLEFVAKAEFAAGLYAFHGLLPGYSCDERSLSRFTTYDDQGKLLQATEWKTRPSWNGDDITAQFGDVTSLVPELPSSPFDVIKDVIFKVPSARSPSNPLRVFWEAPFAIKAGVRVRIELKNIILPRSFDDFSAECRSAFDASDSSELFINNQDCCKEFTVQIGKKVAIVAGAAAVKFSSEVSISASFCPNYGSAGQAPAACAATPTADWTDRLRFTCCQFDQWSDNRACDVVWCRAHTTPHPTIPNRCCDVPFTTVVGDSCAVCTYGNWKDTCCDYIVPITAPNGVASGSQVDQALYDRYHSHPYCLQKRCQCEDFNEECCSLGPEFSPYWNTQICPICTDATFHQSCCLQSDWAGDNRCLCFGVDFYYDPDYCCNKPGFAIIELCPVLSNCAPEEQEGCGCDCDEEPSCPCFLLPQPTTPGDAEGGETVAAAAAPAGEINYVKYEKHEMEVSNVQSGHNTVVINHLHIDTHIDINKADDLAKLTDLLPSMIFNINSGCSSTDPITAVKNVVTDIVSGVKAQVKSDLDTVKAVVTSVKSDVKDVITGAIGGAGGVVAGAGKPVRIIVKILRKSPLNAIELVALRLLIITQCALSGQPQASFNVQFISQFAVGAGASVVGTLAEAQQGVTFDLSNNNLSANDVGKIADSSGMASAISKQFGTATVSSANIVAASNECTGGCSASCQCELFHPCTSDDQCLSSKCATTTGSSSKVCVSNDDADTSAAGDLFNNIFIAALVLIASSLLLVAQQFM